MTSRGVGTVRGAGRYDVCRGSGKPVGPREAALDIRDRPADPDIGAWRLS